MLVLRVLVLRLRVPHPSRRLRRVGVLTLIVTLLKSTLSPIAAAAAALAPVPDRQTIARIVEQVFTARGIPRRGISTAAPKSENLADAGAPSGAPSFAPSAKGGDFASDVRQGTASAVPKRGQHRGFSP